jgi:hypothetical protein
VSIHNPIPKFVTYRVRPESDIEVAVTIGDGQVGGWAFGFEPGDVTKGTEKPAVVGKGSEVIGKMLQIVATVVDVNPATNHLSAIVTISGGPGGPQRVTSSFQGADSDTAILTTLVMFQ